MLYLSGSVPAKPEVLAMLKSTPSGVMGNPAAGYNFHDIGMTWAADNGCFAAKWSAASWLAWLVRHLPARQSCLFAVVPDVVCDHTATLRRWNVWASVVDAIGYPPAFVAQNGCTPVDVPWTECSAVFIGGDDSYKLGTDAHLIVAEARRRDIWAHMGRVNSLRRMRIASDMGCNSVDGTFLAFGPDKNMPRLASWHRSLQLTPSLFTEAS